MLKRIHILVALALLLLILPACSPRKLSVRDLETFPQQALAYDMEDRLIIEPEKQEELASEYLTLFLSPWTGEKAPLEQENRSRHFSCT